MTLYEILIMLLCLVGVVFILFYLLKWFKHFNDTGNPYKDKPAKEIILCLEVDTHAFNKDLRGLSGIARTREELAELTMERVARMIRDLEYAEYELGKLAQNEPR